MKHQARFGLLFLTLLLASCEFITFGLKNPLSDPNKAKPDARLLGVWKPLAEKQNEQKDDYLFIGKASHRGVPSGIMKAIIAGFNVQKEVFAEELGYFFTTADGNNQYANIFESSVVRDKAKSPDWDKRNIKMYILVKYKVEGDRLTIWFLNRDAAEAAIQKGQLKGRIVDKVEHEGKWEVKWGKLEIASSTKVTTLTDAENLLKFLADGGDKVLFPGKDKMILTRVK